MQPILKSKKKTCSDYLNMFLFGLHNCVITIKISKLILIVMNYAKQTFTACKPLAP